VKHERFKHHYLKFQYLREWLNARAYHELKDTRYYFYESSHYTLRKTYNNAYVINKISLDWDYYKSRSRLYSLLMGSPGTNMRLGYDLYFNEYDKDYWGYPHSDYYAGSAQIQRIRAQLGRRFFLLQNRMSFRPSGDFFKYFDPSTTFHAVPFTYRSIGTVSYFSGYSYGYCAYKSLFRLMADMRLSDTIQFASLRPNLFKVLKEGEDKPEV